MSERVAYIERTDRGLSIATVRLVGTRLDQSWSAPLTPAADDVDPASRAAAAAQWLAEKLVPVGAAKGRRLAVMCLDCEGAACSWFSTPTADPGVIAALLRVENEGGTSDDGARAPGVLATYGGSSDVATVQAVARGASGEPGNPKLRMPVLAIADGPARLLLDELDRDGVTVGSVTSLWHAAATVWDPAGPANVRTDGSSRPNDDRVVADAEAGITAVALVDPRGRLVWSWSERGVLVAAGAIRLRVAAGTGSGTATDDEPPRRIVLDSADAARLTADWLAWAAQIGCAPARAVCVIDASADEAQTGDFGASLTASWPSMTVDLVTDADPLGATLRRMSDVLSDPADGRTAPSPSDPARSLVGLSRRPGRAHRRMYIWSSLAIVTCAAMLGAAAWQMRAGATKANALRRQVADSWRESFKQVKLSQPAMPGTEAMALESELSRQRQAVLPPERVEAALPVLEELATLSYVLSLPDFDLKEISIDSRTGNVRIDMVAPDISHAEALWDAMGRIDGSNVTWRPLQLGNRQANSQRVGCVLSGVLAAQPAKTSAIQPGPKPPAPTPGNTPAPAPAQPKPAPDSPPDGGGDA